MPTMDGKGLLVNKAAHLAERPLKRALIPGAMQNHRGEASEVAPHLYYNDDGCMCIHCWRSK